MGSWESVREALKLHIVKLTSKGMNDCHPVITAGMYSSSFHRIEICLLTHIKKSLSVN